MESLQGVSWQYENFSSAKEISPPISPAPASPILYSPNYSVSLDGWTVNEPEKDPLSELDFNEICRSTNTNVNSTSPYILGDGASSFLGNSIIYPPAVVKPTPSALVATDTIRQVGHVSLPTDLQDMDFGPWDEPSTNLELFGELGLAEAQVDDFGDEIPSLQVGPAIQEESVVLGPQEQNYRNPADFDAGIEAFFNELGPFEKSNGNREDIPLIDAQELLALQNEGEDLGLIEENSMAMDEDSSMDGTSVGSPDGSVGQEIVVYTTDDSQTQFGDGFAVVTINSENSSDSEDELQYQTINALQRGEFELASKIYPAATVVSTSSGNAIENQTKVNKSAITKASLAAVKPERRGRKPSSASNVSKTWVNVTDKIQRKKEQNKTAATRYRQKIKMQNLICLTQEKQLEAVQDDLVKQKDELKRKIESFKEALRLMLAARKTTSAKK